MYRLKTGRALQCLSILVSLLFTGHALAQGKDKKIMNSDAKTLSMKVINPKDQSESLGPESSFTGTVHVTPIVQGEAPSCLTCASVRFQKGAHSAWHTHPKGQLLIVTDGEGLIQQWGQPIQKIKKGDVIWTPPGVKHWHGAAAKTEMTHTSVVELENGKGVDWLEKVSDDQYKAQ